MGDLKKRTESLMHSRSSSGDRLMAGLLSGAAGMYAGAVKLRDLCYRAKIFTARKLPCRVISVGNITAGGTGKTPMTIYLAGMLRYMGYRPAVLSRGYKGGAEKNGAIVSDGRNLLVDFETAGDEPLLMACRLKGVPVLVGGNRFRSGMMAVTEFDPDIIILDDGFQHRRLHRDLDLVLMDAKQGIGNACMLPRGTLREPVTALGRCDAVVFTRSSQAPQTPAAPGIRPDMPVFHADHEPYLAGVYHGNDDSALDVSGLSESRDFSFMEQSRVFAFSGIARNTDFRDMLEKRIGRLAGFSGFADHHFYTEADLQEIVRAFRACGAGIMVTTEKDFIRIAGRLPASVKVAAVGVKMSFTEKEEGRFAGFIRQKLAGGIKETP
ncbi:MAG: tetraacyldisaccharide 4'-kinase [Desulfobacterales bacterium]